MELLEFGGPVRLSAHRQDRRLSAEAEVLKDTQTVRLSVVVQTLGECLVANHWQFVEEIKTGYMGNIFHFITQAYYYTRRSACLVFSLLS